MTHPPGSPRRRPTAYPLLHLAREAIHGHAMIAERVAEAGQQAAAEHEARRAAAAATRAAAEALAAGAGNEPANPAGH